MQPAAPRGDAACVRPVDEELLEAAVACEAHRAAWEREFRWCLAQPPLAGFDAQRADQPLTLASISGQRALRFPAVSDDPEWLTARSMGVLARRLAPAFAASAAVCLDVTRTTPVGGAPLRERDCLRMLCDGLEARLPASLARLDVRARELSFAIRADHAGIGELLRLRSVNTLGRPEVVIRLPDSLLLALAGQAVEPAAWSGDPRRFWHGLTELSHRDAGIALVLQGTTRSSCALAGVERAETVLPRSLFEVGAGTAWLAVRLDLAALRCGVRSDGLSAIRRLLRAGLRLADNLVDQIDWGAPELRQDALLNRRLAVHVEGLGELIDQCQLDPAHVESVNLVQRWVNVLRRALLRESSALAGERGPFPGLELRELESTLSQRYGSAHAERMLRQARLRHRHLLVMSPFAVFPGRPRHPLPAYLHLLPGMRSADTVAMQGHRLRQALPLGVYRRLLQMSWAIARNRP